MASRQMDFLSSLKRFMKRDRQKVSNLLSLSILAEDIPGRLMP